MSKWVLSMYCVYFCVYMTIYICNDFWYFLCINCSIYFSIFRLLKFLLCLIIICCFSNYRFNFVHICNTHSLSPPILLSSPPSHSWYLFLSLSVSVSPSLSLSLSVYVCVSACIVKSSSLRGCVNLFTWNWKWYFFVLCVLMCVMRLYMCMLCVLCASTCVYYVST